MSRAGPDPGRTPPLPRERLAALAAEAMDRTESAFAFLVEEWDLAVAARTGVSGHDWQVRFEGAHDVVVVRHDAVDLRIEVDVNGVDLRALVVDALERQGRLDREQAGWIAHLGRATGTRPVHAAIDEHGELLRAWASTLLRIAGQPD